jgi:hypothetical protein
VILVRLLWLSGKNVALLVYQTHLLGFNSPEKICLLHCSLTVAMCDLGKNLPKVDAVRQAQIWDTSQISKRGGQMRAPWQVASEEV